MTFSTTFEISSDKYILCVDNSVSAKTVKFLSHKGCEFNRFCSQAFTKFFIYSMPQDLLQWHLDRFGLTLPEVETVTTTTNFLTMELSEEDESSCGAFERSPVDYDEQGVVMDEETYKVITFEYTRLTLRKGWNLQDVQETMIMNFDEWEGFWVGVPTWKTKFTEAKAAKLEAVGFVREEDELVYRLAK